MATHKALLYSNIKNLLPRVSELLSQRNITSVQVTEAHDDDLGKLDLSQFEIVLSEPNKIFSLFSKYSLPSVKYIGL